VTTVLAISMLALVGCNASRDPNGNIKSIWEQNSGGARPTAASSGPVASPASQVATVSSGTLAGEVRVDTLTGPTELTLPLAARGTHSFPFSASQTTTFRLTVESLTQDSQLEIEVTAIAGKIENKIFFGRVVALPFSQVATVVKGSKVFLNIKNAQPGETNAAKLTITPGG
jgi:hypothetical protein